MAVLDSVANTLASARNQADRLVPPQARRDAYDSVQEFAYRRPLLFSFLLSQLLFALLPVVLFASFALGVVATALVAGLLFGLFWIGTAGVVLAAALTVTFGVAVLAWAWAVGAYLAVTFAWRVVMGAGEGRGAGAGKGEMGREDTRALEEKKRVMYGEVEPRQLPEQAGKDRDGGLKEAQVLVNENGNGNGNGDGGKDVDGAPDSAA